MSANKHISYASDTNQLIAELQIWAKNRLSHDLDPTPLEKAIALLEEYRLRYGNMKIKDTIRAEERNWKI